MHAYLLRRIEIYLQASGVSATRFGREALNDPLLVRELRRGRLMRPATSAKVIAHLIRGEKRMRGKR